MGRWWGSVHHAASVASAFQFGDTGVGDGKDDGGESGVVSSVMVLPSKPPITWR